MKFNEKFSTDLLEGLKRAQRFRLEDQRGTEINFELPDFLKDNKLKKDDGDSPRKLGKAPQPAPRLSISRNNTLNESSLENGEKSPRKVTCESPPRIDEYLSGSDSSVHRVNGTLPPPLPPKPRLKPTTWTNGTDEKPNEIQVTNGSGGLRNIKGPIAERINMLTSAAAEKKMPPPRTIYFDQLNSSFV